MSRHSKLNDHADWLMLRSNQDSRTIANAYKETFGTSISHVAIANWFKKNVTPKVNEAFQRQIESKLGSDQEILGEAFSRYASLCAKSEAEMTLGERNYFRTVGEWFDRIAKLRGLYAPQNVTQVGVAVQVKQGDELRTWAKQVLEGET